MLLSIVMMVKNEERFLYKTLNSLKPLMNIIESELIILDTGSTDNTVNIARKFTDKVYFQEWNNNFADMRNKSISYAKGEWLLILDADEVLTDYSRLIEFFDLKLYEKFKSASIKIKNYTSIDLKSYSNMTATRFFKNTNFRYEGSIHEQPIYEGPMYNNIAEFDHYGYIFEDEEFKIKKMKRNEELLFKELKKNPNNPYINYQLGKNFCVLGKNEDALIYLEKSKKLYDDINIFTTFVYTSLAKLYLVNNKNKECESLCIEHIKKEKNNIDIYFYLAHAQIKLGKVKKAIKSLEKYIYLVENYDITAQANVLSCDDETIALKDNAILSLIMLYYNQNNYSNILTYFDMMKKNDIKKQVYFYVFTSIKELNRYELLIEYYNELDNFENEKSSYYYALEIFIKNLRDEEKNNIYKLMSNIDGNYGELNKIRLKKKIGLEEAKIILKEEKDVIYGCVINLAIYNGIDLIKLIEDIDSVWIEKYLSYSISYDKKITIDLYKYIMELENTFDLDKIRLYNLIAKILIYSDSLSSEKYKQLFYIYNMYSYKYIKLIYKDFDDFEILKYLGSDIERFNIEFRNLVQNKNKEKIEYVLKLKELLKEYPFYKKILEILIEDAEKNLKECKEFKQLKCKLISNIENMINEGNILDAKVIIEEYSKNFEEDFRILNIKGIISVIEGEFKTANLMFKRALSLDINNNDILYNINYLIELNEI